MSEILKGSFLTDKKGRKMEIVDAEARAKAEENAAAIGELSEGMGSVVCLDKEVSVSSDWGDGTYWSNERICMPIVPGVTYDVTYNGVAYSCVAKMTEYYELYIGNAALASLGDGTDTGEPFLLVNYEGEYVSLGSPSEGLARIKVTSANPDAMNFRTPILRLYYDDAGTSFMKYTFEEIVASYKNGIPPVFRSEKNIYPLNEIDVGNGDLSKDKITFGYGYSSITVNKDGSVSGA